MFLIKNKQEIFCLIHIEIKLTTNFLFLQCWIREFWISKPSLHQSKNLSGKISVFTAVRPILNQTNSLSLMKSDETCPWLLSCHFATFISLNVFEGEPFFIQVAIIGILICMLSVVTCQLTAKFDFEFEKSWWMNNSLGTWKLKLSI